MNSIGCHDLFRFPAPKELKKVFEAALVAQGKDAELKKLQDNEKEKRAA